MCWSTNCTSTWPNPLLRTSIKQPHGMWMVQILIVLFMNMQNCHLVIGNESAFRFSGLANRCSAENPTDQAATQVNVLYCKDYRNLNTPLNHFHDIALIFCLKPQISSLVQINCAKYCKCKWQKMNIYKNSTKTRLKEKVDIRS